MFYGIRSRLVGTYLLIIILSVTIFEIIAVFAVRTYYLDTIDSIMKSQAEIINNFYNGYFTSLDIKSVSKQIIDNFSSHSDMQIQITDQKGQVFGDSQHSTFGETLNYPDLINTIKTNKQIRFMGYDKVTKENILSYTIPLNRQNKKDELIGIVRLVTTLEVAESAILTISLYLIILGIIIILVVFFISLKLSNTIIRPIKNITDAALEIAKGNLDLRIKKRNDDEIGILSDTLNYMAEEIKKSEKLKNEFISSITHEIRTPLTSIKGWAITIKDIGLKDLEVFKRGIHIINSEVERLSKMVEELLDFSGLQSNRFSLFYEQTDMNSLISSVYEQMKPLADKKQIKMNLDIGNDALVLDLDKMRIRQVLINLFDNAIKYTNSNGEINIFSKENRIIFQDDGCGIDQEELEYVKKRFFRGSNVGTSKGIGLGLSICDQLIKAHGWNLEIISQKYQGTKVIIQLEI